MNIYPAVDIKGGRCVRLLQGKADQVTQYHDDPVAPARQFLEAGAKWIHVVDLDGAFEGKPVNLDVIKGIAALGMRVEMGGGMRDFPQVQAALDAGVARVIIGTRACEDPDFVEELLKRHNPEQIAVGIDAKDGMVAVKGWVETSRVSAMDMAKRMESIGVKTLIYTDISRDGMLTGPNYEAQQAMLEHCEMNLIASGGVAQDSDIERFAKMADNYSNLDGVIVGKALYEGHVNLRAALAL